LLKIFVSWNIMVFKTLLEKIKMKYCDWNKINLKLGKLVHLLMFVKLQLWPNMTLYLINYKHINYLVVVEVINTNNKFWLGFTKK